MGCTLTKEQIGGVKGRGFLHNKGTNAFNARVITGNGKITAEQMMEVAKAAEKYGDGGVCFTSRLCIECTGVDFDNIESFEADIEAAGLSTGGTGPKVRPVVSCKGTTCQYGRIDTFSLSQKIHERFYKGYREMKLPHKFKIAVGGCPNNCVKPDLNDLGVIGQYKPILDIDKCRGCKKCFIEAECPMGAPKVVDGKISYDMDKCNFCGRCVTKCPFGVFETGVYGYKVYIGGRWGKKYAHGKLVNHFFETEDEVLEFIDKTINYFHDNGNPKERFAETIDRIGFEKVQEELLSK